MFVDEDVESDTEGGSAKKGSIPPGEQGPRAEEDANPGNMTQSPVLSSKQGSRTEEDERLEREVQDALASDELRQLDYEALVDEQQSIARAKGATANGNSIAIDGDKDAREGEKSEGELSDLDEEDVAQYLNTEEEYEQKKEIWQEVNKEYLEQQALMEKMKAERPEEYRKLRPSRTPKKRKNTDSADDGSVGPASKLAKTTADGGSMEVIPAKSSSKLNYDAIKSLGGPGGFGVAPRARSGDEASDGRPTVVTTT